MSRYVPIDLTKNELVTELQKAGYSERHPLDVSRTTTALDNMLATGSTESANILGRNRLVGGGGGSRTRKMGDS
jgi:hypothetical protein